uniref:IS701 family transposase n=1 Tax=Streptomyces kaempferi TaxID=333725 RepID=UPI0036D284CE
MTAKQIAEWDAELSVLTGSLGYLFNRPEPRVVFAQFIEGLLAELPAKNGWTLAERAGHVTADRMQWLLNGSVWDADRLRDAVRDYVVDHLGDADASLVIDDTQAQKKGSKSVGVAFQHCGLTGDVRNCQVMVMLSYATAAGQAFIDRRLYLPEDWTTDRDRCREAGIPDKVAFATKPELAIAMLEQARSAGAVRLGPGGRRLRAGPATARLVSPAERAVRLRRPGRPAAGRPAGQAASAGCQASR